MRIGKGFDIHRLKKGAPLYLGGIRIEHPSGLEGHSDADVLIHAICDALLGAAGLGDIGELFPDTDPRYAGIRSEILLQDCLSRIRKSGFRIQNVDSTLFCEEPRLEPHKKAMRKNLCALLDLSVEKVNIKATTLERIGALGGGAGIAAEAVVLLLEEDDEESA